MKIICNFMLLFTLLGGIFVIMRSENCYAAPPKLFYKPCPEVNFDDDDTNGACVNSFEFVNRFYQGRTIGARYTRYSVPVCERHGTCCTPPIGEYLDSLYQSFKIHYMNGTMWDYFPDYFPNVNL